ncbi:hypothetical protein [Deinococcus peraridilitoris]|uniref:Uncharacterized protein n=1 Tax=Deinococcus peraridilitoris (strain DSM 19664 / LMG 22246 / CIP 109416 / KR-200) TaxID=937777 RepID=L0A4R4_DEIPD|nr:hypothetical protein [Deinococcus peraridilitoris]AFZ68010.1 hypothetical protein Deipe_2545 [Deinococcus peraridilitoris DSM 19664]
MAKITVLIGTLLTVLGIVSYALTAGASFTALIPAVLGALFVVLGLIGGRSDTARRHAMHAAAALALLGVLGSLRVLPALGALLSGRTVERPVAVFAQGLTLVLCALLLALAVRSFIAARRARRLAEA